MAHKNVLTSTHIKYLLALKKLNCDEGVKSVDIANLLNISKSSVHSMMDSFLSKGYIIKKHGGRVYLTKKGINKSEDFDRYRKKLKEKLYLTNEEFADNAVYAFLGEISEPDLVNLIGKNESDV